MLLDWTLVDDTSWILFLLMNAGTNELSYRDRVLVPDFRLDIQTMSDQEAKDQFRFSVATLKTLVNYFKLPERVVTQEGVVATPLEALAICCRRLAFPCRWIDMAAMFGRAPSTLCHIFYFVVEHLDEKFSNMLFMDTDRIARNINRYCNAIASKDPDIINGVWGFIDGTVRPICRPGKGQQAAFNGHKRVHAMKFQTVVAPDGIICHLFGPVDGRRHDLFMLSESRLKETLEENEAFHGKVIYGDPAYGCNNVFCCPYKGCQIDVDEAAINRSMSAVRVSVEWTYGQVTRNFSYLDFKRLQAVGTSPVATFYKIGVLLTNCITIDKGGNTNSRYFKCNPPSFEEYFASSNDN